MRACNAFPSECHVPKIAAMTVSQGHCGGHKFHFIWVTLRNVCLRSSVCKWHLMLSLTDCHQPGFARGPFYALWGKATAPLENTDRAKRNRVGALQVAPSGTGCRVTWKTAAIDYPIETRQDMPPARAEQAAGKMVKMGKEIQPPEVTPDQSWEGATGQSGNDRRLPKAPTTSHVPGHHRAACGRRLRRLGCFRVS